ncbi:hypothetical protein GPX89_34320 [Nocardia sp. ET3-3]|uniref:Uncharacterized protein n=1 Tax=Nocardia terrae TaxID=2675851 RepID=A0A7K1V765_9NOCA|nr:hypothetical protein [Nocardia terrae]MVU82299.1 hypothetical protein [Nocardia terrae]
MSSSIEYTQGWPSGYRHRHMYPRPASAHSRLGLDNIPAADWLPDNPSSSANS